MIPGDLMVKRSASSGARKFGNGNGKHTGADEVTMHVKHTCLVFLVSKVERTYKVHARW